jgi:hypothetical protein
MKITSFDSDSINLLYASVQAAVTKVAETHGVRMRMGKVSYRSHQCSMTLEIDTLSRGNESLTREAAAFKMAASFFGLTPEHLGQTFRDQHGLRFKLVGFDLKARKNRFIVADVPGKEYRTTEEVVLRGFGVEPRKDGEIRSMTE